MEEAEETLAAQGFPQINFGKKQFHFMVYAFDLHKPFSFFSLFFLCGETTFLTVCEGNANDGVAFWFPVEKFNF